MLYVESIHGTITSLLDVFHQQLGVFFILKVKYMQLQHMKFSTL